MNTKAKEFLGIYSVHRVFVNVVSLAVRGEGGGVEVGRYHSRLARPLLRLCLWWLWLWRWWLLWL